MSSTRRTRGVSKDKAKIMRIAGVNIPTNKRGEVSLTYIFGVGRSSARKILGLCSLSCDKKAGKWTEEEAMKVRNVIADKFKVEGVLRGERQLSIKRLIDIASYRGVRHAKGITLRGQKTKNNCRTRKGKRKTVANKKRAVR